MYGTNFIFLSVAILFCSYRSLLNPNAFAAKDRRLRSPKVRTFEKKNVLSVSIFNVLFETSVQIRRRKSSVNLREQVQ